MGLCSILTHCIFFLSPISREGREEKGKLLLLENTDALSGVQS